MTVSWKLQQEAGYTLIETLVSMALFLTVLIPVATIAGTFFFYDEGHQLHTALRLAETTMNRVILEQDFSEGSFNQDKYLLQKKIERTGRLLTVHISVSTVDRPEKVLLNLQKSILLDQ